MSAAQAQHLAHYIAWGPAIFQVSRLMLKYGLLDMLRDAPDGLTLKEMAEGSGLSDYAIRCLTEASLSAGTVKVDPSTDRFTLSKAGWFLLTDPAVRVNIDFNHDVSYEGLFRLDESLSEGRPAGLEHFGPWHTIYEGLSSLPADVQHSWFAFDHFYSDSSFAEALEIIFSRGGVRSLYDVGGNTGLWAQRCVAHDTHVRVTVIDLPQQIAMMKRAVEGQPGADRIEGYGMNLLDASAPLPAMADGPDAIWMSQFLDCFSKPEIVSILRRARAVMQAESRLYIMETLWDRQRYETATLCLTMTSLYFTAMANGNSKMYSTADMEECIEAAGLHTVQIHDHLGMGHSIIECGIKQA